MQGLPGGGPLAQLLHELLSHADGPAGRAIQEVLVGELGHAVVGAGVHAGLPGALAVDVVRVVGGLSPARSDERDDRQVPQGLES